MKVSSLYMVAVFSIATAILAGASAWSSSTSARLDFLSSIVANKKAGASASLDPNFMLRSNDFFPTTGLGTTGEIFAVDREGRQTNDTRFYPRGTIREFAIKLRKEGRGIVLSDRGTVLAAWDDYGDYTLLCVKKRSEMIEDESILIASILMASLMLFFSIFLSVKFKQEIKQKERKISLVVSEFDMLMSLIDSSCLVSESGPDGGIIYANKLFCEVSGYQPDQLLGNNHSMLSSGVHSSGFWSYMYDTTINRKSIWYSVIHNRSKDGKEYIVKSFVRSFFDRNGGLVKTIGVSHDLTPLLKGQRGMKRRDALLSSAAYQMRHDLRNPLSVYLGRAVAKIKRQYGDDHKDFKLLYMAYDQAMTVYESVYKFTDLINPGTSLETEMTDLSLLVRSYISGLAYSSDIFVGDLGFYNVHSSTFLVAIKNLVENGHRYNDSKTKKIKIHREGDNITIEDNGIGLSAKDFDLFSTAGVSGQTNGSTGLGLSISISILEKHDFSLTCVPADNGGTKMIISPDTKKAL